MCRTAEHAGQPLPRHDERLGGDHLGPRDRVSSGRGTRVANRRDPTLDRRAQPGGKTGVDRRTRTAGGAETVEKGRTGERLPGARPCFRTRGALRRVSHHVRPKPAHGEGTLAVRSKSPPGRARSVVFTGTARVSPQGVTVARSPPLPGSLSDDEQEVSVTAFAVLFSIFVVVTLVLIVLTVRFTLQQRRGRARTLARGVRGAGRRGVS